MQNEVQVERLVLYSKLAFYPMHWEAFMYLCAHYRIRGTVIAGPTPCLPGVHQQLGWVVPQTVIKENPSLDIRLMPEADRATQVLWLRQQLQAIRPDAIWVQEEPNDYFLLQILYLYFFNRSPRIVSAVCENIFSCSSFCIRLTQKLLWYRLNGLLAVAAPSIEGIRAVGMPAKVPAMTLVAGALSPPEVIAPMPVPFPREDKDFIIGFAGRICEEKGWKVLLTALESLPEFFKCIIAGDGPQVPELHSWMSKPVLRGRIFYAGLLPKAALWGFYRALDCLVVPSLTMPGWKEQFGGVLADGMAMGLPLVGSDSGAIPDVIGPAGLIVPEGKPDALAASLRRLQEAPDLRRQLGEAGRQRFWAEFAIPAYACKIGKALQLKE